MTLALTRFRSALLNVSSVPVSVLQMGDSVTEGTGSTHLVNRWASRFGAHLQAAYNPPNCPGGVGFVNNTSLQSTNTTDYWNPVVSGGGADGYLGRRFGSYTVGQTETLTFTGTSFSVQSTAGYTLTVDGGATITVLATGSAAKRTTYTSAVLTRASHAVVFTPVSGQALTLRGVHLFDGDEGRGVHLWENATYGTTVGQVDSGFANDIPGVTEIQPALVIIFLGLNDWQGGTTPAAYKTAIASIITKVKAVVTVTPSFLLVSSYYRKDVPSPTYPLELYWAALSELAAADPTNVEFYNLGAVWNPYLRPTEMSDGAHPNDLGHDTIGSFVAAQVTGAGLNASVLTAEYWNGTVWGVRGVEKFTSSVGWASLAPERFTP